VYSLVVYSIRRYRRRHLLDNNDEPAVEQLKHEWAEQKLRDVTTIVSSIERQDAGKREGRGGETESDTCMGGSSASVRDRDWYVRMTKSFPFSPFFSALVSISVSNSVLSCLVHGELSNERD